MEQAEIIEIIREAVWVTLKIGTPIMLIALVVGLIIALFQALTQIQEMTLTFVPKIIVVFLSLIMLMPFMLRVLITFTEQLADRMISVG